MSLSTFYLVTSDGITFFCKLQILTFHLCFEPKGLLTASNTRHQCKGFVVRFDFVRNQQRQIIATSHDLKPQEVAKLVSGNPRLFGGNQGREILFHLARKMRHQVLEPEIPSGEPKSLGFVVIS